MEFRVESMGKPFLGVNSASIRRCLLIAMFLVASACGRQPTRADNVGESVTRVPVESGDWTGVAWPRKDDLILGYAAGLGPDHLARVSLDGSFSEIEPSEDPDCFATQYRFPIGVESEIVAIKECMLLQPGVRSTYSLVEVNDKTGAVHPFLGTPTTYWMSTVSVSSSLDTAVVTVGGSLCGTLGVVRSSGLVLPSLVIRDGDRSWNLDEGYPVPNRGHACTPVGQASWPTWSPVGSGLAFFASPQSIGVDGIARGEVPSNLYLLPDPQSSAYSVLIRDINSARALTWSPDGEWLAFSGLLPDDGVGTWLLNPKTAHLIRVVEDEAEFIAWSPDGDRLAIVRPATSDVVGPSEIVVAQVS